MAVKGLWGSMDEFLNQCQQSGDSAYSAFRSLLERLEDPKTRVEARIFLSDLQKRFGSKEDSDQCLQTFHFLIQDIHVEQYEGYQRRKKLTMMVIPSIFIPEDWSFTFYEGLNRYPDSIFKDKTVCELGCGNGWISIAIAEKWLPLKVYGLDINPRAVKISWINLYLNALDDNGQPVYDEEGKTLLDRVEFHESDLLAYCRDNRIELERIVGCIPQILNPNPDAMSKMITENASEEAVEEGISVIKPLGIMIFNMGGRPGQDVCKRLFERRGLRVSKLWQTKILQAADTDISALVEIEKNSPHRFEFFMGLGGDQPICARTAWAYGKTGGRISHALSVYSCQFRQPNQVKISFLAYLASVLKRSTFFPYEPPAGSRRFRNLIAGFMKTYHHIPLNSDNVIVFPSRDVAIENALRCFSPQLAIVDEHLSRHTYQSSGPRQSDLMIELIKKLKPQVVVTGMAHFEAITSSAFQHLLDTTREIGSRIFLDISDHFELSSLPSSNGVLKYLAGNPLPPHAAIICGLLKNKVYSDLEVAFMISEEETIFKALSKTVELLEGNTAPISQYYYGCLFHDLLAFQLADRHLPGERETDKAKVGEMIGFSSSAISVLDHAELSITETDNSSLVHMDVDQSLLPIPSSVKAAIFESFSRQNIAESEIDVTTSIRQFIKSNYGFPSTSNTEFIYADCPLPLFNKLVLCCIQEGGTLCFPAGSNGHYVSAARFLKAHTLTIPTQSEVGFKLTEKILTDVLNTVKRPWVYISGPTINPTGLIYNKEEMESILSICAKFGARVIIDTSFSGLEFDSKGCNGWDLEQSLANPNCSGQPSFCVSLLGELSLKMLTGGLTFGFLVLTQPFLIDTFHSFPGLSKPHSTLKYTVKKLLNLREQKAGDLLEAIAEQENFLRSRSKRLKETLENCGWEVLEPRAGVSMVAKPKLEDSNIREAMLKATGLCINSSSWTGIPSYCRFTIALEDSEFERALDCIVKFKAVVKN
ncbi:methionine S-methyltransferase [Actinidia rufa]|uniref:methionine S-methyltransferase n=1 Tax=Actinidia rufa TaxID=165716 RepID=A0A7J0F6X4_9ERIC|nr:methionine S-methyltransferase [Actinidia rufa]